MDAPQFSLVEFEDDLDDVNVAIHAKTKHADLWPLAQKRQSQKDLADELGIDQSKLSEWILLKSCPSHHKRHIWEQVLDKLFLLTGKTYDELWPPALRRAIGEGRAAAQATRVMSIADMELASRQAERLTAQQPFQAIQDKEDFDLLNDALSQLRCRERKVIEYLHGLNGHKPHTLRECGDVLNIGKERVRQIKIRAMRKLRELLEKDSKYAELMNHFD